ncbi:MAG: DUF4142 domain-containing protein [Gammaproteobacteria bacterium]
MRLKIIGISKFISLIFVLLLTSSALPAQTTVGSTTGAQYGTGNPHDLIPNTQTNGPEAPQNNVKFIEQSISASIRSNCKLEIKLSQLALKNSRDTNIRAFADQVILENRMIVGQMKLLVPNYTQEFSHTISGRTRQAEQTNQAEAQMQKLTGLKFDRMYLGQMVRYVRHDEQTGHSAYAMMDLPNISKVGLLVWNLARDRARQLSKLAAHEHYELE